jgi:hypothetical protein
MRIKVRERERERKTDKQRQAKIERHTVRQRWVVLEGIKSFIGLTFGPAGIFC